MHKFEAARQSFLARHRLSGEIGVPSTFGDATEHSLRNDQLTTDSDCENDDGNNGSLVVDEEDDNDIHVVDVDLDDEIESFASDSLLPPLNVLPEAVKEDFLPRTLLGDNAQLPPFQPPLSRSFDCGAGAVRNNTRTKDDAPIRSSLPSFPLGAPPGNSTERNNSSEHYLINHAMRIMTSFATRLHFPENLTSLIIDELFPEKAQMTFLSQPELLHLYNEFFASLLILNPPSNIPSPHIAPATPRNPANPTNPKNLPVTNEHFAWPVFDMAALEFSASEGSGSPPSNSQSLITYHNNELKNNDSSLVLDNVVILVNLPQVSPADPHECESDPLISLVCTQMFMMIGTVKSAYFPLKKVEDGESLEVESTIIYKGVAFVEFEDSAATQRAETAFASALPFYVDLDNNSDSLQCRRFKTYSNSNENSFENDRSFNENHAEDAELDTSEEIAPFDVDAALKEALAPLEEHKKLTEERDEREREAAASYAVGAAAIAAMRGGLRRVGGENLAEEDESRNKRRQQQWASLINDVEIKLEEAIVSKCVNKIAKYDAKLVSLYGEVVETGSKGVFGNEGTLMMVQRLLYKDEGKSVVDDVASDSYNGSDSESDNESKPDLTVDERSLWRRCLQGERLRSAALMRKMLVSEKGHEKTKAENARLRHLLDDRSVRLNEARQSINQLEQIRDSLRRQQDATSGRLSAQREAIARLAQFQRRLEISDETVRELTNEFERVKFEKEDLELQLKTSERRAERERQESARKSMEMRMYDHRRKKSSKRAGERSEAKNDESSTSSDEESIKEQESFVKVEECMAVLKGMKDQISEIEEVSLKQLEAEIDNIQGRIREEREQRILKMQNAAEDARRQEKESKLCVVCCENEKSCLLLPCRHLCCCEKCGKDRRLKQCPICRCDIDDTVNIFL